MSIIGELCRQKTHGSLAKIISTHLPKFFGFEHVAIIFANEGEFFTMPPDANEARRQQ